MTPPSALPRSLAAAAMAAVLLTGCASSGNAPGTGTTTGQTTSTTAITRDVLIPLGRPGAQATVDNFAIAPWSAEHGECSPVRTATTGATFETAYYPSQKDATVHISLTLDSAGRLIRSTESHGRMYMPPPGVAGQATPAIAAADDAAGITIILDYQTDVGALMRSERGNPMQSMAVSTRAVGELALLGSPADKARAAARMCGVGQYASARAEPPSVPGTRSPQGPDDVARDFFDAVGNERWTAAAADLDSAALVRFRLDAIRGLLGYAKSVTAAGANPAHGISWSSVADTNVFARYDTVSVITQGDSTTVGALAHLAPAAFAARALEIAYTPRVGREQYTVLGSVSEGDSVAHVVYRGDFAGMRMGDASLSRSLMHLRRVGSAWKIAPQESVLQPYDIINGAANYRMMRQRQGN